MIPAGKYIARATGPQDAQMGTDDKQRSFVFVRYQIKTGEFAGQTLGHYFYFGSEAQKDFSDEALERSGCTFEGEIHEFRGLGSRDVQLVVEIDDYNPEKPKPKIKYINELGGVRAENLMKPDARSSFEKEMKARLAAKGKKVSTKAPEAPPIDDKDIPF